MLQEIKMTSSLTQLNLSIRKGTFYARDLVSEQTFSMNNRLLFLKRRIESELYIKKLKKLGMHALLGVGQEV